MKEKNRSSIFIVCGILFLLFYTIGAARPLGTELALKPEWRMTPAEAQIPEVSEISVKKAIPFVLHKLAGYVSQEGVLLSKQNFNYKITISNSFFAPYKADAINTTVFSPEGKEFCLIPSAGFPFFQDDRLYVFLPGGNSVAQYDTEGNRKWVYESYTPITAFNSTAQGTVMGFADGELTCLNPQGQEIFSLYPGGSSFQAILGAAVSHSGKMTACVSGVEEQRFILTKLTGNQNKIIFHSYLEDNLREQTFVGFSSDDKTVFFNNSSGLGVADCEKLTLTQVPIKGKVLSINELSQNLTAVLSVFEQQYIVSLLEKNTRLMGDFTFSGNNAFLSGTSSALFISRDQGVSKLAVVRR